MSLNKAIKHGKEYRKPYYDFAKQVDSSCRNHGSDNWARDNRLYQANKVKLKTEQHVEEYLNEVKQRKVDGE